MNPTPTPSTVPPGGKKPIQLTGKQGCLMLIGVLVVFGGITYWTANRFPQSTKGTVTGPGVNLVPRGCFADRTGNQLTITLDEANPPQGFREENRAIVLTDGIQSGRTLQPRAVDVTNVAWINADKVETPVTCSNITDDMTVFLKRRGGISNLRSPIWSGTIKATCSVPDIGAVKIDLELENCDY